MSNLQDFHVSAGPFYRQARTSAVVWDRTPEGRMWVSGADRLTWLQGLLTNDVASLRPGHGCYACYLTPQGRMITDMRVLELGDRLLMDVPRDLSASLIERLDPFVIAEDVALADATATLGRLSVHGPRSAHAIERMSLGLRSSTRPEGASRPTLLEDEPSAEVGAGRLAALAPNEALRLALGGAEAIVARSRDLRLAGFDVYLDPSMMGHALGELAAGGVNLADEETFEMLRVEAGLPRYGVDMDDTTIPLEAGIEGEAISFTKGCYVGQEVVIRVMHRGHGRVARRLVGLRLDGEAPPASPSADFVSAAVVHQTKDVGRVTSVVWSGALGCPIALGYVARDLAEAGARVELRSVAGALVGAVVTSLPFLAHESATV